MPLWVINLLSLVGSLIALGTLVYQVVSSFISGAPSMGLLFVILLIIAVFLIFFSKIKKYHALSHYRLKSFSSMIESSNRTLRDTLFKLLHKYKTKQLNQDTLDDIVRTSLKEILDSLCVVMEDATGRPVSSSVKVFIGPEAEDLTVENAKITTFCRSSNSDCGRIDHDVVIKDGIPLSTCTDFMEIITTQKDRIYVKNIKAYKESLERCGRVYSNANLSWERYYKSTIIVPIRMEYEKLYFFRRNDSYHMIGFLCVDSLYTDAFQDYQEKYNCDIMRGVSDLLYILLSKYNYYYKKLHALEAS